MWKSSHNMETVALVYKGQVSKISIKFSLGPSAQKSFGIEPINWRAFTGDGREKHPKYWRYFMAAPSFYESLVVERLTKNTRDTSISSFV